MGWEVGIRWSLSKQINKQRIVIKEEMKTIRWRYSYFTGGNCNGPTGAYLLVK